jgi:hypothetical protein
VSSDQVNHPPHYTSDPSGVECITIARHRTFNIGNAIKYLWRSGLKVSHGTSAEAQCEDMNKAAYYIFDEIVRLGGKVTCRHPALVEAVVSGMARVVEKPPAPAKPKHQWVRLEDMTDGEPVLCAGCRCNWWETNTSGVVHCAKCGSHHINIRGAGDPAKCAYKIVGSSYAAPEL